MNDTHKLLWDLDIQTDHLIMAWRPDFIIIKKNKKMQNFVDIGVQADHRIKLKEFEKTDKYLDLAMELKKLWNMKGAIRPIMIGAFGTVTKGLLKGVEDFEEEWQGDIIQITTLLRMAKILRRVLDTRQDLLSLKLQWKTINWCEKLSRSK